MVVVLIVPSFHGFLWMLVHTIRERKKIVVVEHFRVIGLFVGCCGFLSGL